MDFAAALKQMRRMVFVHSQNWRTAVICPDHSTLCAAWDEAKSLIEASSLKVEQARYVTRNITLERGAPLRFFDVDDWRLYRMAGHQYTHIMVLRGEYPVGMLEYIHATLRSGAVPTDNLIWQDNVVL